MYCSQISCPQISILWAHRTATIVLAVSLIFFAACSDQPTVGIGPGIKQSYSLCPKTPDAGRRLYAQLREFSQRERAHFSDVGPETQEDLSKMGSSVPGQTGGDLILVTVEKPGEFRISATMRDFGRNLLCQSEHGGKSVKRTGLLTLWRGWIVSGGSKESMVVLEMSLPVDDWTVIAALRRVECSCQ
jgi:hypothetical protein